MAGSLQLVLLVRAASWLSVINPAASTR